MPKIHKVRRLHSTAIFLVFIGFPAPYTSHTQAAPPYIPAVPIHIRNPHDPNSPILASCPLRPARGCGRPAQAATHTHQPPSGNSQKTAKSAIPHLAGHTLQPMPRRSPCASDPHTGHVPTRFRGSPHTTSKLQKSRHWFRRDQRFRLHKSGTHGPPQIPCVDCWRGTACPDGAPTRRDQRPVHSNLRIQPVYSNSLRLRAARRHHVTSSRHRHRSDVDARGVDCPAFASRLEGWHWSYGSPGGGQLRGGICVSFPSVCRTLASGLHCWFRIFPPPAVQGGSVGIRRPACRQGVAGRAPRDRQAAQPKGGRGAKTDGQAHAACGGAAKGGMSASVVHLMTVGMIPGREQRTRGGARLACQRAPGGRGQRRQGDAGGRQTGPQGNRSSSWSKINRVDREKGDRMLKSIATRKSSCKTLTSIYWDRSQIVKKTVYSTKDLTS